MYYFGSVWQCAICLKDLKLLIFLLLQYIAIYLASIVLAWNPRNGTYLHLCFNYIFSFAPLFFRFFFSFLPAALQKSPDRIVIKIRWTAAEKEVERAEAWMRMPMTFWSRNNKSKSLISRRTRSCSTDPSRISRRKAARAGAWRRYRRTFTTPAAINRPHISRATPAAISIYISSTTIITTTTTTTTTSNTVVGQVVAQLAVMRVHLVAKWEASPASHRHIMVAIRKCEAPLTTTKWAQAPETRDCVEVTTYPFFSFHSRGSSWSGVGTADIRS